MQSCNTRAFYCHLWPVRLYNIFTHYLINGMIFGGGEVTENKMGVLIFCTAFFPPATFLILIRTERDMIITVHMYSRDHNCTYVQL
jgi:hypothetical protein